MNPIRNSRDLRSAIRKLKTQNDQQEIILAARLKSLEESLEPRNLIRAGISALFKKNKSGPGLIPVLAGAGVEFALQKLLDGKLSGEKPAESPAISGIISFISKFFPPEKDQED
jgi:hypothetical protein